MPNKTLKINPRFQKVFPSLTEDEINNLESLLKRDGCMNAIVVWDNTILDGHNRYVLCLKHNIPFETIEKKFHNEDEAELWLRQFGGGRRNLTSFTKIENAERIAILMGLTEKFRELTDAEKKQIFPHDKQPSMEKVLAKKAKVSHGQVAAYNFIKNRINEKTKEELRRGDRTIGEVHKKEKTKYYHELEEKKKNIAAVEVSSSLIKGWYNNDILAAPVEDNSLNVIITDPPYPREFLDCWKKLAEFAVKKLKKNGILIAMSGQSYLPEVYENMTMDGLDYYWTGCIYTPGMSPNLREKRLKTNWKPFLIYTKGGYGERTFQSTDVYISKYEDTASSQQYHKWGQSYPVFDSLIKDYTYITDLICDPFMGGGTCAIACLDNKRNFIGIEIDKLVFNTASNRVNDCMKKINK